MINQLAQAGYPPSSRSMVIAIYGVVLMSGLLVAAALHGAAFYGLRRVRRWGWLAAVIIAAFWSVVLVGIPVLVRLTNRGVRETYGVT
jgi:hypothetical protein